MKLEQLKLRPYARLLTMLGDQLMKNERIALVELIKNAYDADASKVEVRFENFEDDMTKRPDSHIIIQDDGSGMTLDTVRDEWMNPAAPTKYLAKREGSAKTPRRKRIIQGEKGIGRFAILKLGKVVTVTTRPRQQEFETILTYDFSRFDEDFICENDQPKTIYLDQIRVGCTRSKPAKLLGRKHGTVIKIQELKGEWDDNMIKDLCRDISSLTDPVSRFAHRRSTDRFEISISCNGQSRSLEDDHAEELKVLIEDKPVLKIQGEFHTRKKSFSYKTSNDRHEISLLDAKITGLWVWRRRFHKSTETAKQHKYACGNFKFQFYIFDLSRKPNSPHSLSTYEKGLLKNHRIYLYRDGVRVYPYGDPDDDWLEIDIARGYVKAGDFFSNDQILGWIDITQAGNPKLRDKTNREGLIESGGAAHDLIFLVKTFLSYIKQHKYSSYQAQHSQNKIPVPDGAITKKLVQLRKTLKKLGHDSQVREVSEINTEYKREKNYLTQRAKMTEELAGVGLSVEMASHDIMLLINRARDIGKQLDQAARSMNSHEEVLGHTSTLVGVLQQVTEGMRDVQILFKSSRRRRKTLKIDLVLEKTYQIYRSLLEQKDIRYQRIEAKGSPLIANTTDGVVMQVLINLFDNATYWLETVDPPNRKICVTVNGNNRELIFADSGPGIDSDDLPYIFEPFYSGKGQKGRGLGLYIARQLLEQHGYSIAIAKPRQRCLPGANFVIRFIKEDN